jgi:hypothetical protein
MAKPKPISWIHVEEDGSEVRYDHEPADLKVLRCERRSSTYEICYVKKICVDERWKIVPPRGRGWVMCGEEDYSTTWSREIPSE